jgi:hypothetical protein
MTEKDKGDTVEIPRPVVAVAEGTPPTDSALVRVELAAVSHRGLVRPNNEDHYLVLRYGRTIEKLLTNLADRQVPSHSDEVGYGMLVADGVGERLAARSLLKSRF